MTNKLSPVTYEFLDTLDGLDHGVGHSVALTSQKGLHQGSSLAIFSHGIRT
jgi:hypothetical protein